MSGIAGVVRLDGAPPERAHLERMLARLAHRGPDGAGLWTGDPCALGHRMHRTTPESLTERQPLCSPDGRLVLTVDARIDNRAELIALLARPASDTDADLILHAYERWGERCAERLLGDFAFAVWDGRRRALFCARDHFGVRPFYYHHRPGRLFAFASEIKGLLALPDVPRRLNETRVAHYLAALFDDKAATFYQDILRLPPAHAMLVTSEGIRRWPYWALDPGREIRLGTDAEYAEAFREVFTEAVRCRLRSTGPVGAMLSGGLDSSSIVCVARAVGPLHTFSVVFHQPEADEQAYMRAVVAGGGVQPHWIDGDRLSPLDDLDRMLADQDEPFYAPNLFLHDALYRAGAAAHAGVMLDGLDGDLTVSHGIAYLGELARAGRLARVVREVAGLSRHFGRSPWRILRDHVIAPAVPEPAKRLWRTVRGAPNGAVLAPVDPAFAHRVGLAEHLRGAEARRPKRPRERDAHHYALTAGLIPSMLEVADRAAAAAGVEPRYPFFDRRVVELCLALPGDQKLRDGWTRWVLRTAMEGLLPLDVQWRGGKADLSPAFLRGLVSADVPDPWADEIAAAAPYVAAGAMRVPVADVADHGTRQAALTAWKVLTLARWLSRTPREAPIHPNRRSYHDAPEAARTTV